MSKKVKKSSKGINLENQNTLERLKLSFQEGDLSQQALLVQLLIPLGLQAVDDVLQSEVTEHVGEKSQIGGSKKRWGSNPGSVYLGDQKVSIKVPRVRDLESNEEVDLKSYHALQSPA